MTPMVHYYEFYGAGLSCERQEIHYIQRKRPAGEEDITSVVNGRETDCLWEKLVAKRGREVKVD